MKKFSVKTIVAIGIGAALFFVLGRFVSIPSPVPNTTISTQYGLLAFMSVVYGPVAGALMGFIGHALIDFSYGWGIWWSWVIASGVFGLLMGLGTAIGGKKIIKSVGMDMVKLEKYQGFSADIAAALSLLICSVFSLPVSTTHAKTTSIMGVGAVKRLSAINFGVVKEMVMTWILTFPGCGLVGFLMTKLFLVIFA